MSEFYSKPPRTRMSKTDWNALLDHGLEKPASYIVRKNGSYYEAIDGSTAKISYGGSGNMGSIDGTNAGAVINAAIAALSSGGAIFVKAGTYNITTSIRIICSNLIFGGEGPTTLFTRDASLDAAVLYVGGSHTGDVDLSDVIVENIAIDGKKALGGFTAVNAKGIKVRSLTEYGADRITIRNVVGHDCGSEGISFDYAQDCKLLNCYCYDNDWHDFAYYASDGGLLYGNIADAGLQGGYDFGSTINTQIIGNIARNHTESGIYGFFLSSSVADSEYNTFADNFVSNSSGGFYLWESTNAIRHNLFMGNTVLGATDRAGNAFKIEKADLNKFVGNEVYNWWQYAVQVDGGSYNILEGNRFVNCGVKTNNTYDVIRLYTDDGEHATYNIIKNNYFISNAANKMKYAIREVDSNQDYNVIKNNYISGAATAGLSIAGSHTEVKHNEGYVTENGGTATLLNGNTEVTVTHGCDYTPDAEDIDVHPIETLNAASFWYVDTITATTFKIKVDANPGQDVDFKWSVRRI